MRYLITLLLLSAAPCAHAEVIDRVVAVVNDDIVTLSELEDVTRTPLGRLNAIMDPVTRDMKRKAVLQKGLDDLVGKALIAQEAARRNLKIEDRQVDAHLNRVQRQQRWTDQQMSMYLTSQGLSIKEFREEVRKQLLQQRVVGTVLGARVRISDSDLENYYKKKRTRLNNEFEVSASHILLKVRAGASSDEESAVKQRAIALLERVRGGADFAETARAESEGPTAARGGFLGSLRRGTIDPRLEAAVFATQPGQVEGPVRSPFGYHIIKVLERKVLPPRPFAEVKEQLREELHRRKLDAELGRWITELKGKAFIEERL